MSRTISEHPIDTARRTEREYQKRAFMTAHEEEVEALTERLGERWREVAGKLPFIGRPKSCAGDRALLLAVTFPLETLKALLIAAENPRRPKSRWRRSFIPSGDHHRFDECLEQSGEACGSRRCDSCPKHHPHLQEAISALREAVELRAVIDKRMWSR